MKKVLYFIRLSWIFIIGFVVSISYTKQDCPKLGGKNALGSDFQEKFRRDEALTQR